MGEKEEDYWSFEKTCHLNEFKNIYFKIKFSWLSSRLSLEYVDAYTLQRGWYHYLTLIAQRLGCSPKAWATGVLSQVKSYQRHKKWYLMFPCLTSRKSGHYQLDTKLHLMMKIQIWSSKKYSEPLHCHYY